MAAAAMALLQRELQEEEQYATPPRVPPPGEAIETDSETSDGAAPEELGSGQSAGQSRGRSPTPRPVQGHPMDHTPTPGGGVGPINFPETSSSGTLGSTPLDPGPADQPAYAVSFYACGGT